MRLPAWLMGALLLLAAVPVTAGEPSLQDRINAAQPGDTVVVRGGRFSGSLIIDRPLHLIGEDWPAIDGHGEGTIIKVTVPGVEVRGFRIRGSGRSLDQEHAGIHVSAPGATITGNILEDVLFGIVAKNADGTVIRDNRITGKALDLAQVGNGIRVWFSHDVQVLENRVMHTREILVEQSNKTVVRGNAVTGGFLGLHLMRDEDPLVEHNDFSGNTVGIYGMYVNRMTLRHNRIIGNRGASGYGVGLKDGEGHLIEHNWIVRNNVGIYFDNSPWMPDSPNTIRNNVIIGNDVGMRFTPVTNGNRLTGNDLIDNLEQVEVTGKGRLGENDWTWGGTGNYWSDYVGYDAGGDGIGDYPYRSSRLFENLMDRQPVLRWFWFSPAAAAVDLAAKAFPAVEPEPKMEDRAPLMAPQFQVEPLPPSDGTGRQLAVGLLMAAAGCGVGALALTRPRLGRTHP